MNESETLNRSFTIILAVHQPYSIMLHVVQMLLEYILLRKRSLLLKDDYI